MICSLAPVSYQINQSTQTEISVSVSLSFIVHMNKKKSPHFSFFKLSWSFSLQNHHKWPGIDRVRLWFYYDLAGNKQILQIDITRETNTNPTCMVIRKWMICISGFLFAITAFIFSFLKLFTLYTIYKFLSVSESSHLWTMCFVLFLVYK